MIIAWFSLGISAFLISLAVGLVLIAMGVAMIVKRNKVAELTIGICERFSLNGAAYIIDEVYVVFASLFLFVSAGVIIFMSVR